MKEKSNSGLNYINGLAKVAKKLITNNKYLDKKKNIFIRYNELTKNKLKFLIENNNKPFLPLEYLNQYFKEIENDYNNLKTNYDNIFSKCNSLLDECRSDISMGKPILTQTKVKEFSLHYLKLEKDDIINLLKESIKSSKKFKIFREQKRDSLMDIKDGNKEMETVTTDFHQNMLLECKKYNKNINKILLYQSKKIRISQNIELLKQYINKNKVNNYIEFPKKNKKKINGKEKDLKKDLMKSERIINYDRNKIKYQEDKFEYNSDDDKNKDKTIEIKPKNIILDFIKITDLFDISNVEGEKETIIDNELHSDDESVFENKIRDKNQLSTTHLKEIKKTIHRLNLNQISYNTSKANEVDLYSLQRRNFKNKNLFSQIKEMQRKIKNKKNKLDILKQKENIMRDFIKKLKDNYESLKQTIYQKSEINIGKSDFIISSLNGCLINDRDKENEEEDKYDADFLDNIDEVNETFYNENEENEQFREIKEKKYKNEDIYGIEEKKMEIKILKKVLDKKEYKLGESININNNKKLLKSLPYSMIKIHENKKIKRARSK